MARLLLVVMLLSCAGPTTVPPGVSGTLPPAPTSTLAAAPATPSATPTRTPDPTGVSRCVGAQLQAVASGLLATDSFVGALFIANRGPAPCTLRGTPELALLAKDGSPLDVKLATVSAVAPSLVVVPVSQFREDPAGLAGAGAAAPLQWSNYCDDVLPMTFRVTLPEAGGIALGTFVDLAGRTIPTLGAPRCDDVAGTSTLTVYPFQEPVR